MIVLLAALFVQGALKDGVTTWIPVYIQETYGISPILAVAGTRVIPLCNLFGWQQLHADIWNEMRLQFRRDFLQFVQLR